jgi:hypothetical protein
MLSRMSDFVAICGRRDFNEPAGMNQSVTQGELEALVVANDEFGELEASIGVFCPFEAIGMVRQEIRHGRFLTYYLDPQRPHGFGTHCLRALMKVAADAQRRNPFVTSTEISPLDVHLMQLESAALRREWRHIDMLAVIGEEKLIVAIELKIDAAEGRDQLAKYRKAVREQWPEWRHVFIFLTKRGEDASEDHGKDWLSVPLEELVNEFEQLVARQLGSPDARYFLASYVAMLRRNHLTNEKLESLAARIWSQHRQALEFLIDHRPSVGEGVFGELLEKRESLALRMTQAAGQEVITDHCSSNILRYAVKDWDTLDQFLTAAQWTPTNRLLLLEIERSGDRRSIRLRFVLGPARNDTRLRYHQALVDAGVPTTRKKELSQQWTRLSTRTVAVVDNDSDSTLDFEAIARAIEEYALELIPLYASAFGKAATLKSPIGSQREPLGEA